MNCNKGFLKNAVHDIFTGVLVVMFFLLIAGATVAAAQDETKPGTTVIEIELEDQYISAIDTTVIADSIKIIESKFISGLREELALLASERKKYSARLAEINRAIARRKDEK